MQTYHVTWEIDIDAETPREAAEQAFGHMQRPGTSANVFDVSGEDGEVTHVDLEEDGEGEDGEES